MTRTRRLALASGVFYLLTFAFSIPAFFLYEPVLTDPAYIVGSGGADTRIVLGAVLEMLTALAGIGTAVAVYPIISAGCARLRRRGPTFRLRPGCRWRITVPAARVKRFRLGIPRPTVGEMTGVELPARTTTQTTMVRGMTFRACSPRRRRMSPEPRPYVLVHGIGASHRYLTPLHADLARSADVYSIDLPGFGGATPGPRGRCRCGRHGCSPRRGARSSRAHRLRADRALHGQPVGRRACCRPPRSRAWQSLRSDRWRTTDTDRSARR